MKKLIHFLLFLILMFGGNVSYVYGFYSGSFEYRFTGTNQNVSFFDHSDLQYLIVPSSVYYNGVYYTVTEIGSINHQATSVTIPNTITTIGDNAFSWCSRLTSITIPNSVTKIGNNAFEYCGLTSITIPNSVTSIGRGAFKYCRDLTSITLPDNMTTIPGYLLCGCTSLPSVIIPSGVTSIEYGAFSSCSSITSIRIPSGVTSIGEGAFSTCQSLASLTLPSGVTTIGKMAFQNCNNLSSVNIPSGVTIIGEATFFYCGNLSSIVLPSGVTEIGAKAFCGCSRLSSVNIPSGVTEISEETFCGCSSLTSINLPCGITTIGKKAFYRCSRLRSINIPNNFCGPFLIESSTIGSEAFRGCSSLQYMDIPFSVTEIGYNAFVGCQGLQNLVFYNVVPPTLKANAFDSVPRDVLVTVPCGSLQAYRSASDYSYYFRNMIEDCGHFTVSLAAEPSYMGSVSGDGVYSGNDSASISATPNNGYRFVCWSDGNNTRSRRIHVTSDTSLIAYFEEAVNYTISLTAYPSNAGSVSGAGTYATNTTATIEAIPNNGYRFTQWSDGNTDNPRSITVNNDISLVAYFEQTYTVTLTASPSYMGSVLGGGTYRAGEDVTISATPASQEYYFSRWSDGNTSNPRTIYNLSSDLSLTAYFNSPSGIENISDSHVTAFAQGRHIIVMGAKNMSVAFYDMQGRQLETKQSRNDQPVRFDAPATGIYMVRVGNLPAQRVAILR